MVGGAIQHGEIVEWYEPNDAAGLGATGLATVLRWTEAWTGDVYALQLLMTRRATTTAPIRVEVRLADPNGPLLGTSEPVTPEDVIFTIELLRDKGHPRYGVTAKKIGSMEKVGERGVRITFKQPDRELPLILEALNAAGDRGSPDAKAFGGTREAAFRCDGHEGHHPGIGRGKAGREWIDRDGGRRRETERDRRAVREHHHGVASVARIRRCIVPTGSLDFARLRDRPPVKVC